MLVRAQIVYPELPGPGLLARRLLVEEDHVCLYALRVKDARGQPQQSMHVTFVQQLAPYGFTRAAFEQHVVWDDHRRAPVYLEDSLYVLNEVQLLVTGRGPEIIPHNRQ